MAESSFDVIPYEDIKGDWQKLGSGSFGKVYKGTYLGIEVAIKEVLPSTEYDVAKYFEREWRLMKEARHPNVVLYLGLSRAPDGRIFIISEYIENGNLRLYIHDKTKPFPWRLRISFATDICRALAYLHARKCIHRDLKGENLLLTANLRLKITDFGFARIAARNADESKRLTFCGTDAYMSPEILLGNPFDLPTDLFSLGVIFAEIAARRLADDAHFKRNAPWFGVDEAEVRRRADKGCPDAFVELALACLKTEPEERPNVKDVLERLRAIELEVLARPSEVDDGHVGSVKFLTGGRRPGPAPRIPSFGMGVAKDVRTGNGNGKDESDDSDDEDLMQAVMGLGSVDLGLGSGWSDARVGHESGQPLLQPEASTDTSSSFSTHSDYSTTVIRAPPAVAPRSSILTVRASPSPASSPVLSDNHTTEPSTTETPEATDSMLSIDSFHTASAESVLSIAGATEGGSTLRAPPDVTPHVTGNGADILPPASHIASNGHSTQRPPPPLPLLHRFTLIKPGAKRSSSGSPNLNSGPGAAPGAEGSAWSPFDFFFSSGLLVARCDLCAKRLGWKPVLECDDCGLRTHIKCGDFAPRDCGVRPVRHPNTNPSVSVAGSRR